LRERSWGGEAGLRPLFLAGRNRGEKRDVAQKPLLVEKKEKEPLAEPSDLYFREASQRKGTYSWGGEKAEAVSYPGKRAKGEEGKKVFLKNSHLLDKGEGKKKSTSTGL